MLLALRKRSTETLQQYAGRYWELFNEIEGCDRVISARGFKQGLGTEDEQVYNDLTRHKPKSMEELMTRIEEWCQLLESKAERGMVKCSMAKSIVPVANAPLGHTLTPKKQVNNIKPISKKGPKPADFVAEKTFFNFPIYNIID